MYSTLWKLQLTKYIDCMIVFQIECNTKALQDNYGAGMCPNATSGSIREPSKHLSLTYLHNMYIYIQNSFQCRFVVTHTITHTHTHTCTCTGANVHTHLLDVSKQKTCTKDLCMSTYLQVHAYVKHHYV